jgi:hypothetical protein
MSNSRAAFSSPSYKTTMQSMIYFGCRVLPLALIIVALTGCATSMPTEYGQFIEITSGPYKGERGRLVSDCSGFELYKVELFDDRKVCVRSWNMQAL